MTKDPLKITATEIVDQLQTAGFAAFWVGGCVRDFLLGRQPGDYDIATSARPEQVEKLFKRTVPVGRKFGRVFDRASGLASPPRPPQMPRPREGAPLVRQ